MPKPGTANTLVNPFAKSQPLVKIGGSSNILSTLSKNTQQFNPASAGSFNTTPTQQALSAPAPAQIQPSGTTALGTKLPVPQVAAPAPLPQQMPAKAGTAGSAAAPQSSPAPARAPDTSSFKGIVGNLVNKSISGAPVVPQATQGLLNNAQSNPLESGQAYTNYNTAVENQKNLKSGIAQQYGNIESQPIPLEFQQGREQALARQYASQLDAGQQAINQAQTGLGYGIQEQQAQQSGYNQAGNLSVAAQGQTQSGLTAAAGLAQPQQYGITSTPFYPSQGNTGQFGSLPGGGQGAFNAGKVQGDVALGAQNAQNISANNQAKAIKTNIQSYIASNPTLNPSQFSDVNSALQFLNGKVSNPQYQTLSNYLQEYINTLAPILGVGGDTTNLKTQIANGFVNAAASGQSLTQVLDGIEQLAQAKLNAQEGGSQGSAGGQPAAGGGVVQTAIGPVNGNW